MIRRAAAADLPRIVEMGQRFLDAVYADAPIGQPDPGRLLATAMWLLDAEDRTVFVVDDGPRLVGMIGLFVHPHPFTGVRIATEMFWWVEPEARGRGMRLLRAGEQWARESGAETFQMIAPDDDVARLYEHLGFLKIETSYARRL